MTFLRRILFPRHTDRGRNTVACTVALSALALLHLNSGVTRVGVADEGVGQSTGALLAPPPPPLPNDVVDTDEGEVAETSAQPVSWPLKGESALQYNLRLLQQAESLLSRVPCYSATFFKQERIQGELAEGQTIQLKMRHKPFSVYMKWLTVNKGQQALYVDKRNDNKMLVQLGGWKARLPALKLDPLGSLALSEARYPITKAGILEMVREAAKIRQTDIQQCDQVECVVRDDERFDERDCYLTCITYASPKAHGTYRKSLMYIDKETSLPLCIRNFTWPDQVDGADPAKLDDTTLIEFYKFTNINLKTQLANSAFDRNNQQYRFR